MVGGIVIHPLKVVWWDNPKVASTTMKVHFAKVLEISFKRPHSIRFDRTNEIIPGYFNFGFVRNPYLRLQSLFNNFGDAEHDRTIYSKFPGFFWQGMNYSQFIDAIISIPTPDKHFIEQSAHLPEGIHIEKMEDSLILKVMGKHNSTNNTKIIEDIRIYEHYKQDFTRFGY